MAIVIRRDIPPPTLTIPNTDYGEAIENLQPGESFAIMEAERVKLLVFVKRRYGISRLFSSQKYKGELFFHRIK